MDYFLVHFEVIWGRKNHLKNEVEKRDASGRCFCSVLGGSGGPVWSDPVGHTWPPGGTHGSPPLPPDPLPDDNDSDDVDQVMVKGMAWAVPRAWSAWSGSWSNGHGQGHGRKKTQSPHADWVGGFVEVI